MHRIVVLRQRARRDLHSCARRHCMEHVVGPGILQTQTPCEAKMFHHLHCISHQNRYSLSCRSRKTSMDVDSARHATVPNCRSSGTLALRSPLSHLRLGAPPLALLSSTANVQVAEVAPVADRGLILDQFEQVALHAKVPPWASSVAGRPPSLVTSLVAPLIGIVERWGRTLRISLFRRHCSKSPRLPGWSSLTHHRSSCVRRAWCCPWTAN